MGARGRARQKAVTTMGQTTGISWTHHTANFWWGCQRVSPGCENCYAEFLAVTRRKLPVWGPPKTTERKRMSGIWRDIVKWNAEAAKTGTRKRVFVSSMADVFEDHPQIAPWRAEALALLATLTSLDVQLLTKRPQNIRAMAPPSWLAPGGWPAHVWIGTTVEDQKRAEQRIPELLKVPAALRFLSIEPLLEDLGAIDLRGIGWVIVGGESGQGARECQVEWVRSIVAQCRAAKVPVFVKQLGRVPTSGGKRLRIYGEKGRPDLKGKTITAWPEDLRVREMPEVRRG